jgi:hypothetical protein
LLNTHVAYPEKKEHCWFILCCMTLNPTPSQQCCPFSAPLFPVIMVPWGGCKTKQNSYRKPVVFHNSHCRHNLPLIIPFSIKQCAAYDTPKIVQGSTLIQYTFETITYYNVILFFSFMSASQLYLFHFSIVHLMIHNQLNIFFENFLKFY